MTVADPLREGPVPQQLTYLTTLDWDDAWLDALAKACPDLQIRRQVAESADQIDADVWAQVDVLHTSAVFPTAQLAPRLRWVQLDTSGVEHVRTQPIWASDVEITTLGGIAPVPMAEFTVMSLLALAHHQPTLERLRRERSWPSAAERLATLTPLPVDGATATIVGYGRIGREVARLLRALGMGVVGVSRRGTAKPDDAADYYDTGRSTGADDGVEHRAVAELHDVLPRTDFLVVITPRTDDTIGLIGARELELLKPGACVVNVSRGDVVVEDALLDSLRSGQVAYASLDVFEEEPIGPDSPWWTEPNTLVTPHVAGLAPRYKDQVLELVSTNVNRYQAGLPLLNRADRASGY